MMSIHTFLALAGGLWIWAFAVHLSRLLFGRHLQVGKWVLPKWLSIPGILISGYLAWMAFQLIK